jgi:hypothetical protein
MFAQPDKPMSYRQYRYPPLQRTQGRGTHSCVNEEETKTEGRVPASRAEILNEC